MADVSKTVAVVFEGKDNGATSAAQQLTERIDSLGLRGMRAADALDILAKQTKETATAADAAGTKLKRAGDETEAFGKSTAGAVVSSNLLGIAMQAIAAAGLGKAFIDANVELEKFERGMTSVRGSSELAAKELVYIKDVSNRLGLEVRTAADAWLQMAAATKGTALEGDPARRIFEAVATAMGSLGKSSADTQGALLAVQQIVSKGTVSMEELRGQLGERLPGAFQIAATSMGLTTQELDKLVSSGNLTANEFLPRFATALEEAFGKGAEVDTFSAALNRLKNQLDETFQAIGKAGTFDVLTDALKGGSGFIEAFGGGLDYLGTATKAFYDVLRGGSIETFGVSMDLAGERASKLSDKLNQGLNQSLAETNRLMRQNKDAAANTSDSEEDSETKRLINRANAQKQALKDVADAFTELGIKRSSIKGDIGEIIAAFDTLTKSATVNGSEILAGLEASLKRVTTAGDLDKLSVLLKSAFTDGRLSVEEFDKATALLSTKQGKLQSELDKTGGSTKRLADETRKAAEESRKAEEKAERFRLELEKLASNERIKNIEAKVTLEVTNVQEQTKRIQAAFESLDNTITSTGTSLNDLFKLFAGDNLSFTESSQLREQIDLENKRRDDALKLQGDLTRAQIEQLRAQTKAMQSGESIIKIDGAGLQPHLEAFMWEILRAVQVRVNSNGLSMLLGV